MLFVLAFIGCSEGNDLNKNVEFDYNKFNTENSLWNSSKPKNYQFKFSSIGGGEWIPIDTLIFVEYGQYKKQESNTEYEVWEGYRTIDKIYETI
jgi:hypothetical protein